MANTGPLVWFGVAVILWSACFIVLPFLRGKSDLLSAWNILLLGLILYTGFGSLEARYNDIYWKQLTWIQPSRAEVTWYMLAITVFIATLFLSYYYNPFAKAFAARRFSKWPPMHGSVYFFVIAFCLGVVTAYWVMPRGNFVFLVVWQMSHKAAVFACVFAFMLWYKERINFVWLVVFICVFAYTAVFSMLVFSGRRLLLSMFLGPVLCFYWVNARHWKPRNALFALGVAAVMLFAVSTLYSTFRWFSRGSNAQARTAATILEQLRGLKSQSGNIFGAFLGDKLNYFAQASGQYGLVAEYFVDNKIMPTKPYNTLICLMSYPIPRRWWGNKPEWVGITMVRDYVGETSTNWGIGIAGHGAYEGGIPALMVYAVLLAILIRVIDEPARRHPENPFLIAMYTSILPHVVAIPRGDFGNMTTEVIEGVVFTAALVVCCRILFGTDRSKARNRKLVTSQVYGRARGGQPLRPGRLGT